MAAKKKKLKTVNIKGKEYVEVSTRVVAFNEDFKNGAIETELSFLDGIVRCKATVTPDVATPDRIFTGHAEENRAQGPINKTNAVENCETSAVGRALAMMGIGVIDAIASSDEVNHAKQKQASVSVSSDAKLSDKQKGMIFSLIEEIGVPKREVTDWLGKGIHELNRKEASETIKKLIERKEKAYEKTEQGSTGAVSPGTGDEITVDDIPFD